MSKVKVYSIKCFIDNDRKFTHKLTKRQALVFKKCAKTLLEYLSKEYKI